jgi:hypothetical protein
MVSRRVGVRSVSGFLQKDKTQDADEGEMFSEFLNKNS